MRKVNTHAGDDLGVYELAAQAKQRAKSAKQPLDKPMSFMTTDEVKKLSQPIKVRSKKSKPAY